ncbi:unnamed protein product [Periconia digitata]|uniref:Zn(2)-C6 fungal-type domain-containing protein n=1 Tax=Periconia digitata TaxID=1303443 RepID=A0A9W4U419_9PLEO|nr:unnamed protein product [Periconia digitata]
MSGITMELESKREPRHIACARCRERKVKCDGATLGCGRCKNSGACCQYVRSNKRGRNKMEWKRHTRTINFHVDKTTKPKKGPVQALDHLLTHTTNRGPTIMTTRADGSSYYGSPVEYTSAAADNKLFSAQHGSLPARTTNTSYNMTPTHPVLSSALNPPFMDNFFDVDPLNQTLFVTVPDSDKYLWQYCAAPFLDMTSEGFDRAGYLGF